MPAVLDFACGYDVIGTLLRHDVLMAMLTDRSRYRCGRMRPDWRCWYDAR